MIEKTNLNSILFLFEGDTEKEFYKKMFKVRGVERKIKLNYGHLKGISNLTEKVKNKICLYLDNQKFNNCKQIHVFVAYDRDGDKSTKSKLDVETLKKELVGGKSRIISINEIVATQDLESWFFHDLEGICNFLNIPKKHRNSKSYSNVHLINNRTLSTLFHKHKKHYQKGKRVEGFIDKLDLNKIHNNVDELKDAFELITELC